MTTKKNRPYAPLKLLQSREEEDIGYSSAKNILKNISHMDPLCGISEEDFVDFCLSDDFLWPEYTGPLRYVNSCFIKSTPIIMKSLYGMSEEEMIQNSVTVITELRDIMLCNIFIERWAQNKLSYRPDGDFLDALAGSKKLKLNKNIFDHLPAKCFYLDLTDLEGCGSIHGMFINVLPKETKVDVVMYLLTDELTLFSYYGGGRYDEDENLSINFDEMTAKGYEVSKMDGMKYEVNTDNLDDAYRDRKFMAIIGMQMIAYLSSKKPDIEENEVSKKTYRPRKNGVKPKNKFSEVQSYDVGIRFGSAFRKEKVSRGINDYTSTLMSGRKSPIPHFRSAHWQHFHVGTGRKNVILKWVEPCFVGGTPKSVVVKRVKSEKEESK